MAPNFWGLVAENGRGYLQKVERGFSITMATLEPNGFGTPNCRYDEKPVHVVVKYADTDYILCTLWHKEHIIQTPLNIPFAAGEVLEVHIQGGSAKTKVHLTGFYTDSVSATSNSTERQSILVSSDSKKDKAKKRVSIQEEVNIKRFENDDADMDDDDDDDDDEDYDEDDDDMDDEGLIAMLNGKLGGEDEDADDDDFELDEDSDEEDQPALEIKNGDGKTETEKTKKSLNKNASISLSDEDDDDEDDSDDEDDDEEEEPPAEVTMKTPIKNKKLEALKTPESNKKNKNKEVMKTPENQGIPAKNPSSAGHTPMKFVAKGGIMVHELKIGSGPQAKPGKMVGVYYSGRLKSNNRQFDSSTSGPGFKFRLGKGEVIKGWDAGVDGMKVGGKRRIIIPSHMAYGKKGAPPDIPPNATLVFEIELRNVS